MAELTGGAIWPRPGIDILATSFGVWRGVGRKKKRGVRMKVGVEVEAWSLELWSCYSCAAVVAAGNAQRAWILYPHCTMHCIPIRTLMAPVHLICPGPDIIDRRNVNNAKHKVPVS
jgi:hypothetical protein